MCKHFNKYKAINPYFLCGVLIFILSLTTSCHISNAMEKNKFLNTYSPTQLQQKTYVFDLDEHAKYWPHFEFAIDGSGFLLCWWHLGDDPYGKRLGGTIVLDPQGEIVDAKQDSSDILKQEYVNLFPGATYRQKWRNFIQNADGYGFSDDDCYAIRLFEDKLWGDWNAELWNFCKAQNMIWKIAKIARGGSHPLIEFLDYKDEKSILIAFHVGKAYIISRNTGQITASFEYGPKDAIEVLEKRQKEFHIRCPEGIDDCELRFKAYSLAYDSKNRLLAVGDGYSQRVRIIKLDSPHGMVIELNSQYNPRKPSGGIYHIAKLTFAKDGRYLIIEYDYSSLSTGKSFAPTEIIGTSTWKCCWFENSEDITEVTLSHNGKLIAYKRGHFLEVGSFVPNIETNGVTH